MSYAFDRMAMESVRSFDADGRMHVAKTHISKAAINPYYGSEIPGNEALGLDPNRVYMLFRDPEEIAKAAPTFARIPVLSKHVPITADAYESYDHSLIVGSVGSDVEFVEPYLDADLCIWGNAAIAGIETDQVRELSCAYRYDPDMTPGEWNGRPYDGVMRNIRGNHVAIVESGRAGSDVMVADSNPFTHPKKAKAMKQTRLGAALSKAFGALSPKFAGDSLASLVGGADRKTLNRDAIKAQCMALDAEMDPQRMDDIFDAVLGIEDNPEPMEPQAAGDNDDPHAEVMQYLSSCGLNDEQMAHVGAMLSNMNPARDEDPGMPDNSAAEMMQAMDAMGAKLRAEMKALREAERDVRPVVGDVHAMDSAEQVYCFALDHMGVKHEGVKDVAALRAIFAVANKAPAAKPAATMAHDSSAAGELVKQFPGIARFQK